MHCPKCDGVDLKEATVKETDTKIDHCPQCKGIWFDGGELEAVTSVAIRELTVPPDARRDRSHPCPRCNVGLYRFQYPQTYVEIEMCNSCHGLWLDAGEFKEIKAVREVLEMSGKLKKEVPLPGIKGGLITFIDKAIQTLMGR